MQYTHAVLSEYANGMSADFRHLFHKSKRVVWSVTLILMRDSVQHFRIIINNASAGMFCHMAVIHFERYPKSNAFMFWFLEAQIYICTLLLVGGRWWCFKKAHQQDFWASSFLLWNCWASKWRPGSTCSWRMRSSLLRAALCSCLWGVSAWSHTGIESLLVGWQVG